MRKVSVKNILKNGSGFLTLEFLIANTILIMVLSSVIAIVFGSQSILLDTQNNSEALQKAQELLEQTQALARKDFKLVNPIPEFTDGIYQKKVDVEAMPDHLTKKVTATVSWTGQGQRNLSIRLSSIVANFENAVGGDTCSSNLTGNWSTAVIKNNIHSFAELIQDSTGTYPITDLDVYQGRLYVTSNHSGTNKENFFILNIADSTNPTLISKIDNDTSAGANSGLAGVVVNGEYAYVASATGVSKGQMQIFDLDNISAPIATYHVPGVTGSQGVGNSIAYKDGYVYLGLKSTGGNGPEFHIVDVHDVLDLKPAGSWPSSSLGNDINEIYIKDKYAYLATPNNQELQILDLNDPANPTLVGSFDAPGGSENGRSIYTVASKLYLGRTLGGNELYILDNANSEATLPSLGSYDLGTESINGLIIRDYLAFALTNNQLHILNIQNPANIIQYASAIDLPDASTSGGSDLDCEGNVLFAGTNDNGGLYLISTNP